MDKNTRINTVKIKALSTMLVKLTNMEMDRVFKEEGMEISSHQFIILRILEKNSFTGKELSDQISVSPVTLVPMIDSLEKKGFIRRGKDKNDRRKNPLLLTKKGLKLIRQTPKLINKNRFAHIIEQFGDKKSSETIKLLEELVVKMAGNDNLIKMMHSTIENET